MAIYTKTISKPLLYTKIRRGHSPTVYALNLIYLDDSGLYLTHALILLCLNNAYQPHSYTISSEFTLCQIISALGI